MRLGLSEVAQSDPHQPELPLGSQTNPASQVERDHNKFLWGTAGNRRCGAAGEDLNLARLELENSCARDTTLPSR